MKIARIGMMIALAIGLACPVPSLAAGAGCPAGYRLDDNGNCVKITGGTSGGGPYCGYDGEPCCNNGDGNDCADPSAVWCFGDNYCHNVHNQAKKCEADYWLAQSAGGGTPVTCFASPVCIGAFSAFQADNCDGCWWSYHGTTFNPALDWMGGGECVHSNGVSFY